MTSFKSRDASIKTILAAPPIGSRIRVRGWVRTRRDSKGLSFLEINDGSCLANLQVVAESTLPGYDEVLKLSTGAAVEVSGCLVESPGKGQTAELRAEEIIIHGLSPDSYPLQKKGHSLEFLRTIAHLRPRTNTFGAVFRIRSTLSFAIHRFFQERGFVHVHTPVITGSDCEGAGSMFRVTTLEQAPAGESGVSDYTGDFFGRRAFLTVSGQLEGELFATALSRIYTFGPTFRAENSNTPRHLAEFWMIEPEMAFCDLAGDAALAEEFLRYIISACLETHADDLAFLQKWYAPDLLKGLEHIAGAPFERLTYTEAVAILEKSGRDFEFPCAWGSDLQTEHERYLTEEYLRRPVIVTDYPREIKAFYMRRNDDGRTVAAMDVLFPRIGEIIGGSQREERLDLLLSRIREAGLREDDYSWYLDSRRFGSAPHSGFGLGFERALQFITGMGNIRDVIPFPRYPGHVEF